MGAPSLLKARDASATGGENEQYRIALRASFKVGGGNGSNSHQDILYYSLRYLTFFALPALKLEYQT